MFGTGTCLISNSRVGAMKVIPILPTTHQAGQQNNEAESDDDDKGNEISKEIVISRR